MIHYQQEDTTKTIIIIIIESKIVEEDTEHEKMGVHAHVQVVGRDISSNCIEAYGREGCHDGGRRQYRAYGKETMEDIRVMEST